MQPMLMKGLVPLMACAVLVSCGPQGDGGGPPKEGPTSGDGLSAESLGSGGKIQHVFLIMMENQGASTIYGNTADVPYLNSLMRQYGYAGTVSGNRSNYLDNLPARIPSEPHYIWLEAGTNAFPDRTFIDDSNPSSGNSTASHQHLTRLLDAKGVAWRAYAEGIDSVTGACPVSSDRSVSSSYFPKHLPFVFFQDIAGATPSKSNPYCAQHVRPFGQLAADLSQGAVPAYAFIVPNECNDMHIQDCGNQTASQKRKAGDQWLAAHLPAYIQYANANHGVILINWDEPEGGNDSPFLVVGPNLKSAGYKSTVTYSHSSVVKSLQRIFGVSPAEGMPYLAHAGDPGVNDLGDFFQPGAFP